MAGWRWLHSSDQPATWPFVLRVLGKAALLFVAFNLLFAWWQPLSLLGQVSLYNGPVTGRQRLPYGENPDRAYNLSLNNLEAMFASHAIAQPKAEDEFRVFLIGDSATWGILLEPAETLAGMLNAADLTAEDDRRVQVYNLGYPIMSLTKDLLLLDQAMQYDPDLIVWLFTLESFPRQKQLFPPLVQHNPAATRDLIAAYDLDLDPQDERFVDLDFWDQTIVGQRRELADWLRLQLYGIPWQATGIDQEATVIERAAEESISDLTARLRAREADATHFLYSPGGGIALVGATPERLIKLSYERLETMALAGTAPRGRDAEEDRALGQALLESLKDRAEHAVVVAAILIGVPCVYVITIRGGWFFLILVDLIILLETVEVVLWGKGAQ